MIRAQSADFDAYRQQLASGVRTQKTEEPARQAKGSVQASVQDNKQAAAATPDKLTLSQGAVKASAPEAAVSKDTEKKDSAARVAELSRNVAELKRLQGETAASAPAAAAAVAAPAVAAAAAPPSVAPPVAASAPVVALPAAPAVTASAPVVVAAAPAVQAPGRRRRRRRHRPHRPRRQRPKNRACSIRCSTTRWHCRARACWWP